jgi:N-methylhydantoinase A
MGGTTAKASLVKDGAPTMAAGYHVGGYASGHPVMVPVIDVVEVGAGGGSIAWIDSGGGLRVGPVSAGADPGPACYDRGGTEPTITDANLVLGRLNPDYFLGGELRLNVERARWAIQEKCANRLGLDVVAAAHGIVEIANATMANALRLVSVQRGYDPRDFALVAFGGAGPVHANHLIAETQIRTALIPMSPGTASAMGLLVSDLRHEYSATMIQRIDGADPAALEAAFRELETEGRNALAREGSVPTDVSLLRQMDMRYVGQGYELTIAAPPTMLEPDARARLIERFHDEHGRAYGYSASSEPVELVNLRVTAVGAIVKPRLGGPMVRARGRETAPTSARRVYFAELGGYIECPVYDRYRLVPEAVVDGPAIVEEFDSTTVIHKGYSGRTDRFGNLHLSARSAGAGSALNLDAPVE